LSDAVTVLASIFFDFNLPNAATWFYFSLLLAIALFFKFTRLLSVRNLDVLTLFLLVPGLLLLQEAHILTAAGAARVATAPFHALSTPIAGVASAGLLIAPEAGAGPAPARLLWFGYLWLLCGSGYLLLRCLADLALVRRPALSPNLNFSGMAWLCAALFVCLVAVAVRNRNAAFESVGKRSVPLDQTQRQAEHLLNPAASRSSDAESTEPRLKPAASNAAFWVERSLAMACHLAIAVGLVIIGWRHFQDVTAGMAAATFYLLLPYTAIHVGQVHHVWPTALLVWAIAAYRFPTLSGLLLGLAAGSVYFPALLFPAWLSFYWLRGAGRFALAFLLTAGACLGVIGFVLWMDNQLGRSVQAVLSLPDWQPWKELHFDIEGFWMGVPWAYRLPVFFAYIIFVATTFLWPSPKTLAHLMALSGAVLIGIQFWFADRGGVYVLWYLPILLLLVFRPNLSDRYAVPIQPGTDWVKRLQRFASRLSSRLLNFPEPAARV
jgi:hypothetical protein